MSRPVDRLSKVWQGVADKESARIRDAFVRSPQVSNGARSGLAYAMAVFVMLLVLGMVILAVWLLLRIFGLLGPINGIERLISGFFALLLLGVLWVARPRFDQTPGVVLTAAEAPEFYKLVAQVAQQLNVQMPQRITLLPEVNAFMSRSGFPPKAALGYGLPLWYALHPQERVAILAHELAHERNNDPTRGGLIGFALNMLAHLEYISRPDTIFGGGLVEIFSNVLQWMLSWIPLSLFTALINLVGADQQRAEYRADLLSAEVAGTEATASALDKLHLAGAFESALHKQRHFPERPHAFLELRHSWDTMSLTERQKRRDEYAQKRIRLDDTHPPTIDRIKVVQAHWFAPKVVLGAEQAARIDAELTPFVKSLETEAYAAYRERYGS